MTQQLPDFYDHDKPEENDENYDVVDVDIDSEESEENKLDSDRDSEAHDIVHVDGADEPEDLNEA